MSVAPEFTIVTAKSPELDSESCGGMLEGETRVLLPEDEYRFEYVDYRTAKLFMTPKLIVRFKIVKGVYENSVLERFYGVSKLVGPPKKYGNYKTGGSADAYRDFVRLTGRVPRRDRMSWTAIRGIPLIGTVRTVIKDHRRRELDPLLRYSVIDELRRADVP